MLGPDNAPVAGHNGAAFNDLAWRGDDACVGQRVVDPWIRRRIARVVGLGHRRGERGGCAASASRNRRAIRLLLGCRTNCEVGAATKYALPGQAAIVRTTRISTCLATKMLAIFVTAIALTFPNVSSGCVPRLRLAPRSRSCRPGAGLPPARPPLRRRSTRSGRAARRPGRSRV